MNHNWEAKDCNLRNQVTNILYIRNNALRLSVRRKVLTRISTICMHVSIQIPYLIICQI